MNMEPQRDLGVFLLYWLDNNSITPDAIAQIEHELIKSSPLMLYLHQKGVDIVNVASAIYKEGKK